MQKQKATYKDAGKVADTRFKVADVVEWDSQAGGQIKTKVGTVVAILKPNMNYEYFKNLPKRFFVEGLMTRDISRSEANELISRAERSYYDALAILAARAYKLKFNPIEGMRRSDYHYLVTVEPGVGRGNVLRLYHPISSHLRYCS